MPPSFSFGNQTGKRRPKMTESLRASWGAGVSRGDECLGGTHRHRCRQVGHPCSPAQPITARELSFLQASRSPDKTLPAHVRGRRVISSSSGWVRKQDINGRAVGLDRDDWKFISTFHSMPCLQHFARLGDGFTRKLATRRKSPFHHTVATVNNK